MPGLGRSPEEGNVPTPGSLAGESLGQRSLEGYRVMATWGHRVRCDWVTHTCWRNIWQSACFRSTLLCACSVKECFLLCYLQPMTTDGSLHSCQNLLAIVFNFGFSLNFPNDKWCSSPCTCYGRVEITLCEMHVHVFCSLKKLNCLFFPSCKYFLSIWNNFSPS